MKELLDIDGENRAVRSFLLRYGGQPGLTVKSMKLHMELCGYPHWPDWVPSEGHNHLTKAGAQLWIRHLFNLETQRNEKTLHSTEPGSGYYFGTG